MTQPVKPAVGPLAVLGGRRRFTEDLHVGRPNVGSHDRLAELIAEALGRRWLTNNGPLVQEFERRLASHIGVRHCVAMCNATLALEIAVRAAGLRGEVIVPSFTFVATAHALEWCGLTPVFCDIDPLTHNIDPAAIEALITPRTTGILAVHVWGRSCHVEALSDIARRHGLVLLFDAAHAFGCSHRGVMIGNFGLGEVFSFHATKFFNTCEGGALVTNDDDLARRVRLMMNFGFAGYDAVVGLGINAKMHELSAAMGLASFDSLEEFVDVNRRHHESYTNALRGLPGISLVGYDTTERCNYQYVVIEVDRERAGLGRDDLQRVLWAEGVRARRYFYPACHRMEPYLSRIRPDDVPLPHTERLTDRVLCLPTGTAVSSDDIRVIGDLIGLAISQADRIRGVLASESPEP